MSWILGMNGLQVCGMIGIVSAFVTYCACVVSGRASRAEDEVALEELQDLARAINRNRYPAKTIVKTVCRACHQQIDRSAIDYRHDLGAVHVVDGLHIRCRRGGGIEIDLDDFRTAEDLVRHLRSLEGVTDHA